MRRTVHLLTAADAVAWRPRHDAMLRQRALAGYRRELAGVDLDALAAAGRAVPADGEPRTMTGLARALPDPWRQLEPRALGEVLVAALIPMVQLPPRGLWRTAGGARYRPLARWVGQQPNPLTEAAGTDPVGQTQVRRYLAADGPAASADLRAWCGLAGLPAAVAAVRDELVVFRDQRGRQLLDLPDAPRPDPDTPAPVRFLPAFDNAVLGYDDRSRIIDDADRGLSRAERAAVAEEGESVAAFLSDGDSHRVRLTSG
ncbi:DNA glycosylase AlkZ-like family protein [Solwaraspora sp. WMMB335]|uniref:DNA glycosylase AlkZ-like family protein n=1 Tax=Solwaraspora sp. WMMB335 TaxID=3404118 RepID=UPI003B9276D5